MSRNHVVRAVALLVMSLTLASCAQYPMDMSEDEWHRLSADDQFDARKEQAALDREESAARAAEANALTNMAQSGLIANGAGPVGNAGAGSEIQCVIEGAMAIDNTWHQMASMTFTVAPGHSLNMPFLSYDGRYRMEGNVEFNGHRVAVCDRRHGLQREPTQCGTLSSTAHLFERGITTEIHTSQFIKGSMLCSRLPISNRY